VQSELEDMSIAEKVPTEDFSGTREDRTVARIEPVLTGAAAGRLDQLDSLRGIAALTVVACHMMDVYPTFVDRPETHAFW
jgi:hypothetical protein